MKYRNGTVELATRIMEPPDLAIVLNDDNHGDPASLDPPLVRLKKPPDKVYQATAETWCGVSMTRAVGLNLVHGGVFLQVDKENLIVLRFASTTVLAMHGFFLGEQSY